MISLNIFHLIYILIDTENQKTFGIAMFFWHRKDSSWGKCFGKENTTISWCTEIFSQL